MRSQPPPAGPEFSCQACPPFTIFQGQPGPFRMLQVIYGRFTSPAAEEALVGFAGCAPQPGAGGSVLLRKSPSGWRMVQYVPGRYAWQCWRYPLKERRQLLLCKDGWNWMGFEETELFTIDLAAPEETQVQQVLHLVADNAASCPEVWKKMAVEKMSSRDMNYDAMPDLTVFVGAGKAPVPEEYRKKCLAGLPPPKPQTYTLDFLFNGKVFIVAPWSAETKKLLENF